MRIDAARGTLPGVSPGRRTNLADPGLSQIAEAVGAVGVALKRRENERDAREAERERAADAVTLAKTESGFRERLTQEFDDDAESYDGAAPGFSDRWREKLDKDVETEIGGLDPRLADHARLRLLNVRDNFALAAIRTEDAKRDAFAQRGIVEVAQSEVRTVNRDPASLALARANVDTLIENAPGDRDKLRAELYQNLGASALAGYEKGNPWRGVEALERGDFDRMLSPDEQSRWRGRLFDEQDRREREAKREADRRVSQANGLVNEELKDIDRLRALGLPVSDERYDALDTVAGVAGTDASERVSSARRANRAAEEIRKMPFQTAVAAAQGLRNALASQTDVARDDAMMLDAVEKSLAGMKKQMTGDFLAFAAANRGGVEALDYRDPVASLKKRAAVAEEQAKFYGAGKVRYFTDNELSSLKGVLDSDKNARALFIDAVASAGAPEMLREIAPSAPSIAHAAGLRAIGGDRQFVADILRGEDLKKEKALPSTVDNNATKAPRLVESVYGSAFAMRNEAKARAIESAGLAYDAWSADKSRDKDGFDREDYKLALQRAAGATGPAADLSGGVASINNRAVWVPPYLRQKDFRRLWTSMRSDQWALGNGKPAFDDKGREIPPDTLRRMHPVAVDSGVYILNSERDGDPIRWPVDESGRPWRFDLNKVRDTVLTASKGDENGESTAN